MASFDAAPYPTVAPVAVEISTGVRATTTCAVPAGRTLRLVRLAGTMAAYGYEGELTPWSTRDEERGDPIGVPQAIASCDLTTGAVRVLHGPTGSPREFSASIVDLDRGRLLLRAGSRESVVTWLLDLATGSLTTIDAFVERGVAPRAIDGNFVIGSWTIDDSFSQDSLPAVYSLETGDFRIVTPTDLGVGGTWIEPVDVANGILVGTIDNANTSLLGEAWAFILDTGEAIHLPRALTTDRPYIGAFDGSMIVGSALRKPRDRHAQPFMWRLGQPDVTWLSLPPGQIRGRAVALQGHLIIGDAEAVSSGEGWSDKRRAVVWESATGALLDLGVGPLELSGTRATDSGGTPQSSASAIDGNLVLGFLGDACGPCGAPSFGGTPVVWDISEWVASLRT